MTNVTATATGSTILNWGVYNLSSSPAIRNSSISGTDNSIYNSGTSLVKVADTALDGAVFGTGFTCVGVYDTAFAPLGASCV